MMKKAESIVMSAATRAKIRSSLELAERTGTKYSTMRDKLNTPGKIRLYDLAAWDKVCNFTPSEALELIRSVKS